MHTLFAAVLPALQAHTVSHSGHWYVNWCRRTTLQQQGRLTVLHSMQQLHTFGEEQLHLPSVLKAIAMLRSCGWFPCRYLTAIRDGEWWRLFSSICIHSNFAHLLSNMITFVVLAVPLEHSYGPLRIFAIFLAAGKQTSDGA
jgi:hypothetical protein